MKLKRFHGCCSATPSSCSSPSSSTASFPGTVSSRCCRRQRVGNVVGQFVGNFKRPTDCNKICHNVVHDSGANAPNVASVNVAAATTTKLTTKSHNNSDRQQRDKMLLLCCHIQLEFWTNFLAVACSSENLSACRISVALHLYRQGGRRSGREVERNRKLCQVSSRIEFLAAVAG